MSPGDSNERSEEAKTSSSPAGTVPGWAFHGSRRRSTSGTRPKSSPDPEPEIFTRRSLTRARTNVRAERGSFTTAHPGRLRPAAPRAQGAVPGTQPAAAAAGALPQVHLVNHPPARYRQDL